MTLQVVKSRIVLPQWYTGLAVTMLLLQMGFMSGWSSPSLAWLMSPESTIQLTPDQASWVASLMNLSRFFGSIVGSISTNYFGSKKSIFMNLFPLAIGWLFIALANNVELLYVARLFNGFGLGMTYSVFPIYIGEVSMPEIRGALISLATVGVPIGQLVASVFGSYLSLSAAAYIYFTIAALLMIMFYWLPESPHHLVKVGNNKGAKKAIEWYRDGRGVDEELAAVEKFITADGTQSVMDKIREFNTPSIRNATLQVIALFSFMQLCGVHSVIFYMETILKSGHINVINPSGVVIYVNICGIFAAGFSIVFIDKCGRKFLLLVSSIGVTISMICAMSYFLFIDTHKDILTMQWLLVASMFIYVIAYFIGLMPVPSTILSEIFPANIKCIASCIATLTGASTAFLSTKAYQPMVDAIGESYVFLVYAVFTALSIPYALFIMPETKGKSLQEIQDKLIRKK